MEAARVVEVIPLLPLRPQAGVPNYVAVLFSYHGQVTPVLNLGTLASGVPCPARLSTRIILVEHTLQDGTRKVLGLIAEAVTDAVEKEASDFAATGVAGGGSPYLGTLALDDGKMVQRILPEHLLPEEVGRLLFGGHSKAGDAP